MSELQSPNWNEAKVTPDHLQNGTAGALMGLAKQHNENPSKFMAQQRAGGDTMGIGDMRGNNAMYDRQEPGANQSSFLLMGRGRTKKDARRDQILSGRNALGMDLSYREKVEGSRIMRGGRAKKNHDPFSGGGDRDLAADMRITRQSLGVEGGYVCPQNLLCSEHIARQLGGAELFSTYMDAGREKVSPHEYRVLNGAVDGDAGLKDAVKQVSDDKKIEFVQKLDDPKNVATSLLSDDDTKKVVKKAAPAAPKPPGMDAPKPPNGSGLMDS